AFWRPAVGELADMGLTVARCAAPAAGFAAFMALLWHGPTATLSASTLGDLVHSYASVHMLTEHPYPFCHLGSQGELMPYENMAPMGIAAALIVFPDLTGCCSSLRAWPCFSACGLLSDSWPCGAPCKAIRPRNWEA